MSNTCVQAQCRFTANCPSELDKVCACIEVHVAGHHTRITLQAKRKYQEAVQDKRALEQEVQELRQKYEEKARYVEQCSMPRYCIVLLPPLHGKAGLCCTCIGVRLLTVVVLTAYCWRWP